MSDHIFDTYQINSISSRGEINIETGTDEFKIVYSANDKTRDQLLSMLHPTYVYDLDFDDRINLRGYVIYQLDDTPTAYFISSKFAKAVQVIHETMSKFSSCTRNRNLGIDRYLICNQSMWVVDIYYLKETIYIYKADSFSAVLARKITDADQDNISSVLDYIITTPNESVQYPDNLYLSGYSIFNLLKAAGLVKYSKRKGVTISDDIKILDPEILSYIDSLRSLTYEEILASRPTFDLDKLITTLKISNLMLDLNSQLKIGSILGVY